MKNESTPSLPTCIRHKRIDCLPGMEYKGPFECHVGMKSGDVQQDLL